MRILVVSAGPFTNQIGGGQSYTQDLVVGLQKRGHLVNVLEPVDRNFLGENAFKKGAWNNIPVWSVGLPISGESKADSYEELSNSRIQLFAEILKRIAPEVVQLNGLMPGMVRACNLLGIKHFIVAHHPGEICPKGDLLNASDEICTITPSAKLCGACILKSKKVGWGAGRLLSIIPMFFYKIIGNRILKSNPFGYLGRVLCIPLLTEKKLFGIQAYLKETQEVIAPSKAIANALMRSGVLESSRLKVITHGVHLLNYREMSDLDGRVLRFAYLGRIDYAKGLHILLAAMKEVNLKIRAELHIYGDATNEAGKNYWNQLIKKYGKEQWLYMHGSFERPELSGVLSKIDILVLPAIYLEVFGLVVAESLSAGRPVLATACGGPEEQIVDGINGWIVPPNDVDALVKKIQFLISHPEDVKLASYYRSKIKSHDEYLNELENLSICN